MRLLLVLLLLQIALATGAPGPTRVADPTRAQMPRAPETREVVRAVDGDTLILDGGEKLRLLGIDAPETAHTRRRSGAECYGREAWDFTRQRVVGRRVRLEFEAGSLRDRYGRTLGWVHLEDGTFLNRELLRLGYARVYRRMPRRLRATFDEDERAARREARGLWGPACQGEARPR